MRILYLSDQYKPECYTGTVKFIENIINTFSNNNEVKLFTYCENPPLKYQKIDGIKYWNENVDGIECIKFSCEEEKDLNYELYNKKIYNFAIDIIKQLDPDIIHICHPRRVASFIKAAIHLNKKYIITFTDNFLICQRSFLFTKSCEICNKRHIDKVCENECYLNNEIIKRNKMLAQEYANKAFALITPSDFQARVYEEYFYRKVLTINHGNQLERNKYETKHYPKDKLIFLFNGSSITIKGLIVAIEAFNKLEKINVELHVYGNCDDTVKIVAGKNVKFYGKYNNKELPRILSSVDALICPSIWYENYPFVITEAFMNRVPVIATNEGGMKELVKNFVNGFTFNLGDSDQLSEIIKYIYLNQGILKKLSDNLNYYTYQTIENEMNKYNEIYMSSVKDEKIENMESYSVIDDVWQRIIKSKYNCNDISKYKKCIEKISKKHKYPIDLDSRYRFIVRLKNMECMIEDNKENLVVIWGAGTSGLLTMDILKQLYKKIKIKLIVDKYKENSIIDGVLVKKPSYLVDNDFEYLFICTSPGKIEADEFMTQLNKKVNVDYNYGICVE